MKIKISLIIGCLFILSLLLFQLWEEPVDFNTQIRPILNKNCLNCHGGVRQQGEVSFLSREEALQMGESEKYPIVPGKTAQSELIHRIKHKDPEIRMPPEGDPLSKKEIKLLEKWIDQGAKWEKHWAYIPPKSEINIPEHKNDWVLNEIDQFVFQTLKEQRLQPNQEAQKADLARRLSIDLIGLPPTPEQVNQFITNNNPEAYEILVDELLASPHFGERWASMWLDLARYADSQGYQKDHLRHTIWHYRDWVIHAFNQDMPFDQFTIEQLAGDLLPQAKEEQILATAFHRNTMTNDEGGTDDEEFRIASVIDRLNTTFEIWQASTISCVQCHSHPYDPIKHEEFYKLFAFFNNTEDADLTNDHPKRDLLSPIQKEKKQQLALQINNFQANEDTLSESYQKVVQNWLDIQAAAIPIMQERPLNSSRATHVFERGNWLVHGEEVQADVPGVLNAMPAEFPNNRLGLAKWLVHAENPLTARVIVNRFWEQLFGKGLIETTEDFGTQGAKPSHPELLDWLAYEFQFNHQWSVKALLKQIVLSRSYRQSAHVDKETLEIDPYNRFISRGPRTRLSAEAIRDQALTVSGLLHPKIGGPSVMPYQPDGVWNIIRHVGRWTTSEAGDQHRRALYTFWRRVSPYPSMMAFDSPSRELCVSRRISTNTPLQALVTLNDPVFTEAAKALAKKMEKKSGELEEKLSHAYQLILFKEISSKKLQVLLSFYEKAIANYKKEENNAFQSPEEAALFNVANVLLNMDEFIMK